MVELWPVPSTNTSFTYWITEHICGTIKNWGRWFVAVRVAPITSFETLLGKKVSIKVLKLLVILEGSKKY